MMRFLLLLSVMLVATFNAQALNFTPTEKEWNTWEPMCQARYVVSMSGKKSLFKDKVSQLEVSRWKGKLGQGAWYGLHHFCAGLIKEKRGDLEGALNEYHFTYYRMPENHTLYARIGALTGNLLYKMGKKEEAIKILDRTISMHPNYDGGYIVKAIIARKEQKLEEAARILDMGNKNTNQTSAELNYHLGLAYLGTGEIAKAKEHANKASELGYPLTGLSNAIKKMEEH
ncbi:tetratricopeptide repeat protein [Flocculibacter collagenilyticus]|uniref:tetratricopeptide repeat protein n=1 Tax=Flocculibacter collagenilyticus TaxID=2744479 RepID=UPI0018F5BB1F|nr:tetratricopeptide repeat protein [Flocculibacter collagenilyticus]